MSKGSLSSLSERLAQKMEEDRRQIEEIMKNELNELAKSLRKQSSDVLSTTLKGMESDLKPHIESLKSQAQALEALTIKAWMKPLLITLSVLLGVVIGSSGLAKWLSDNITDRLQTLDSLQRQIEQKKQTLVLLQRQIEQQKQQLVPPGTGAPGQHPARRP